MLCNLVHTVCVCVCVRTTTPVQPCPFLVCANDHVFCVIAELLSAELRPALQDCFVGFAQNIKEAANLVVQSASPEEEEEEEDNVQQAATPISDAGLLMLYNCCTQVRSTLLTHVMARSASAIHSSFTLRFRLPCNEIGTAWSFELASEDAWCSVQWD